MRPMSEHFFEVILAVIVGIVLIWVFWWRGESDESIIAVSCLDGARRIPQLATP